MTKFLFHDLDRKICLTCQYFCNCEREVKMVGNKMFIAYEKDLGACSIRNNFPVVLNVPANASTFCRYKRWVELP